MALASQILATEELKYDKVPEKQRARAQTNFQRRDMSQPLPQVTRPATANISSPSVVAVDRVNNSHNGSRAHTFVYHSSSSGDGATSLATPALIEQYITQV